MNKRLFFYVLFLLPLFVMAQVEEKKMTVGEAVTLVRTFYDAYAKCAQNQGADDESFKALHNLYPYCDGGRYMPIANEFYQMLNKGEGGEDPYAQLSSFNTLFLKTSQEGMSFSYKITGKPELKHAFSMDNDDTNTRSVLLKVEKVYGLRGKKWKYTDTIGVNLAKGQICQVTNSVYTEAMLTKGKNNLTAEQCFMLALASYERKEFDKTFDLLQEALKKQPEEEIMYLLGVMAQRRQGGFKKYPRKVCSYMALFYFNQSVKGRFWLCSNMGYCSYVYFADKETEPFSHNRLLALNTKSWKVGYITPDGKMIIPQKYTMGTSFDSQGRAYVREKDNSWLFVIDTNGNKVESYPAGYICLNAIGLKTENEIGIVDRRSGSWIVPMSNQVVDIWTFKKSYGYVLYMYMVKNSEGKYGLKRIDGKDLLPCEYRNIKPFSQSKEDYCDYLFCTVRLLVNYDEEKLDGLLKQYQSMAAIPEKKLEGIGELITVDVRNWE